jgi:hypothetical protein
VNVARKKKHRIRTDQNGEFIYRHHFIRGKQKLTKVYLVNGVPSDEIDHWQIYRDNADFFTLLHNGDYDILYERELAEFLGDNLGDDEKLPF